MKTLIKSKMELNIDRIVFIGLIVEFICTSIILLNFTKMYDYLNITIDSLMVLNTIIFILSIIFFKYNKRSAIKYTILSLIFFFFSDKSRYSFILVLILIMQGKGMY